MLKNYRLIAIVFCIALLSFEAIGQTEGYKDVLLNGKPARLNLQTGEVTYINGDIAQNRAAKKLKDSFLSTQTEIKTNLIVDMSTDSDQQKNNKDLESSSVVVTETPEITDENLEIKTVEVANEPIKSNGVVISDSGSEDVLIHTVVKGETLYGISKQYNTTVGQLITVNNLNSVTIYPDQELQVSNFPELKEIPITWIVDKGDTLYGIAKRNNTTVDDIKTINDLTSDLIKIGQKLQIQQNSAVGKK